MTAELPAVNKTGKYSATKTAELLGVSVRTIANYRHSGLLKAKVSRANNRYYFTDEEIIRFWNKI